MKRLLVSCFGLGWLPLAPGTWGSLPPTTIFALMYHFGASAVLISAVLVALALAASIVCVKCAPAIIAVAGKSDPGEIVVDEFAGQAVTFLAVNLLVSAKCPLGMGLAIETFSAKQIWGTAVLGFLLFRGFDIAKPWPIRKFEKLPKGWGILADDLAAGVYAGIILLLCLELWVCCLTG